MLKLLTVTRDSCIVDMVVFNLTKTLSVLQWCRTKVTSYNSTMVKQIQAKFNSTAGPQAITKSIGPASCCSLAEHPVVHYANTDTSKMQVTIEVEQGAQLDL